jgi:general secretion pathway protein A
LIPWLILVYMTGMESDTPFSLSPDPRLLYITPTLRTALHKVRYVVDRRQGITAILGDYGLGKTTVMRRIFEEYATREDTAVILLHTPKFKSDYAFLRGICLEYGLAPRRSLLDQQRELETFVAEQFAAGRNVLLMIDEGQTLDTRQLEVLRVLLNFETNERKLLQVILAGQLELRDRLLEDKLGALRSRIFAPTLLSPLSLLETSEMIAFRCQEYQAPNRFTDDAVEAVYELTGGVPREILKVCAIAWELAELAGDKTVPREAIEAATSEATLRKPAAAEVSA